MALTLNVSNYPVRDWERNGDTNATGTSFFKLTVLRDHPDAATLRLCVGQKCVDVDISDIPLGQSKQKTAQIECCTGAGTVQAQKQTRTLQPGQTTTVTAPSDKAVAYSLPLGQGVQPPDAPPQGVVLPGRSVTLKYPDNAEQPGTLEYYEVDPNVVLATLTLEGKVLDANGNVLFSAQTQYRDARPFDVASYSGDVDVYIDVR